MKKEEIFDYSRGLNAPYWIQEIRTKKGTVLLSFSVPVQLSYFIVFILVLVSMFTVLRPIMDLLYFFTRGISYLLYFYVPNKLARLYSEHEIDGKSMLSYLRGVIRYMFDFGLNKKAIYQSKRVTVHRQFRFEKMKH
ncbi:MULTISPECIES: conjugal transfer protein [Streptococcus]|uniref:Conjugal transfer protein n=1 Tax=Streptococcus ruminantium TaxID=1917441 RepID=A0ABU1B5W0_9STRE|nr:MULTISPECIES: conjugal transfer protein [Streptococcus]HEM3642590.1 conjugal transfer protein [Streptococcus suis]MDQ8759098.1 conjugal transfer protein [Streptococcus ruminantium]MDQ8769654.1 conjugal transfer protein [Streptococcus ruminantium]MDQ8775524.1 conjugal transfer protein [Streptococcus ruminantium]MDQ8794459.1 conjugal transfer protein [Streptococcus ruminantium]